MCREKQVRTRQLHLQPVVLWTVSASELSRQTLLQTFHWQLSRTLLTLHRLLEQDPITSTVLKSSLQCATYQMKHFAKHVNSADAA